MEHPPLVELGEVPERWVDGIGKVEALGGGAYRVLLCRTKRPLDEGGLVEREIVFSMITNTAGVQSLLVTLRAIAEGAFDRLALLMQ